MLEFKKHEGVIQWICGVYRASSFALKRNPRNHRIVCGRPVLGLIFRAPNSSHHQHLEYHPRSLWWSSWCCILVPQSDSFQVPLPVFLFTYIPSASSCRLSPCFRLSLVHLLHRCGDFPSFHVPPKAPHWRPHHSPSPTPHHRMRTGNQTPTLLATTSIRI